MKESCNDARVVAIEKEKHYEILNKPLDDNRMELVKVPPDGNCFISATLQQTDGVNDILDLRDKICGHLLGHQEDYITFSTGTNATFKEKVSMLKYQ